MIRDMVFLGISTDTKAMLDGELISQIRSLIL